MKNYMLTDEEIQWIEEKRKTIVGENDYILHDNYAEMILRDVKGKENKRARVPLDKVEELKKINWYASGDRYVSGKVGKNTYSLHRYILNAQKDEIVDHINGNGFDNTYENMRLCSQSQNHMNTITPKDNTSGFKGVSQLKRNGKWRAYITMNRKQINLGIYDTKEEAIRARIEANKKYQGEFAYPNAKGVVKHE